MSHDAADPLVTTSPEPGSAIDRCMGAFTASGSTSFATPDALVERDPATTFRSPDMSARKPCSATWAASSFSDAPTRVSSMSARWKKSVSVGPGISDVTVTPVSRSSSCRASANDCRNDFEAL